MSDDGSLDYANRRSHEAKNDNLTSEQQAFAVLLGRLLAEAWAEEKAIAVPTKSDRDEP